jgi:hypothetical protein
MQAVNSHKRAAQSKVVQMIVPGVGTNVGTKQKQARTGTEAQSGADSFIVTLLCPDLLVT